MAKLHLITYGCQMNEYDSERVAGLLREHRWELTPTRPEADLILVNTCAIREKAEDKVFSKLGELRLLKAQRPDLVIGVMGCMAQLHQDAIQRRAPAVDLVFGSPAIARVAELVDRVRRERRPVLETGEGPLVKITARPPSARRLKAFVTVMEGCEKHCTFCVVPRRGGASGATRPTSSSTRCAISPPRLPGGDAARSDGERIRARPDSAHRSRRAIRTGRRGRGHRAHPFHHVESLQPHAQAHPRHARRPKVCEYFHLPLQSGSNQVLERMNRGYTRDRYLELVAEIRDAVPTMRSPRTSSWLPGRDGGGLRGDARDGRARRL